MSKFFWVTLFILVFVRLDASEFNQSNLEKRVESRWETIEMYKFGETYQFETPVYKKVFPENLYKSMFSKNIKWEYKRIIDVSYDSESEVATVIVEVKTKSATPVSMSADDTVIPMKFNEKWLHINGLWWHSSTK